MNYQGYNYFPLYFECRLTKYVILEKIFTQEYYDQYE